ncbi:MAG: hypothetical protein ACRCWG_04240 [Sarcina sp.]
MDLNQEIEERKRKKQQEAMKLENNRVNEVDEPDIALILDTSKKVAPKVEPVNRNVNQNNMNYNNQEMNQGHNPSNNQNQGNNYNQNQGGNYNPQYMNLMYQRKKKNGGIVALVVIETIIIIGLSIALYNVYNSQTYLNGEAATDTISAATGNGSASQAEQSVSNAAQNYYDNATGNSN